MLRLEAETDVGVGEGEDEDTGVLFGLGTLYAPDEVNRIELAAQVERNREKGRFVRHAGKTHSIDNIGGMVSWRM